MHFLQALLSPNYYVAKQKNILPIGWVVCMVDTQSKAVIENPTYQHVPLNLSNAMVSALTTFLRQVGITIKVSLVCYI